MTWVNGANYIPKDLMRFWEPDGVTTLDTGPVVGVAAFRSILTIAHGVNFWQFNSAHGEAAEIAAYKGDWTYEGFVYMYSLAANHCLFTAGGWAGLVTEIGNVTAQVVVLSSGKITTFWERDASVAVSPSADSIGGLAAGSWYHVGVVKDSVAQTLAYYINGTASGTATYGFNPTGGDSTVAFDLRTGFGAYVANINNNNHKTACATFSTTKRNAAWMTASHARLAIDGALPTDASTWINVPPIYLADIEQTGVYGPTMGSTVACICPEDPVVDPGPSPLAAPVVVGDPEYVDHTQLAADRLCQYSKHKLL